jgi:exonuclease VII large subunit
LWAYLQDRQQRMTAVISQEIERRKSLVLAASRGLPDLRRLVEDKMQRLDDWGERLPSLLRNFLQNLDIKMASHLVPQFRQNARRYYEVTNQQFELLASRLNHASYQRILDRGFCWTTTTDGTFITRASQIKKGATLSLHYVDGIVPVIEGSSPMPKTKKQGQDNRQGELF